jgi:hypothetical protein
LGVSPPVKSLDHHNTGPRPTRDLGAYRAEIGSLFDSVRHHFASYYDEGVHVMLRG